MQIESFKEGRKERGKREEKGRKERGKREEKGRGEEAGKSERERKEMGGKEGREGSLQAQGVKGHRKVCHYSEEDVAN